MLKQHIQANKRSLALNKQMLGLILLRFFQKSFKKPPQDGLQSNNHLLKAGTSMKNHLSYLYHLESRWRNSHVLVYHGPLLIHLLGVAPSTFTRVYIFFWKVPVVSFFFWGGGEERAPTHNSFGALVPKKKNIGKTILSKGVCRIIFHRMLAYF